MKTIKFEQRGDEVELTIEQKEYLILAEADVAKSWDQQIQIEMGFDIYGLDGNQRIQDLTAEENQFIYDEIERRYDFK